VQPSNPTERELEILKILWEQEEATVRQVYEQMSQSVPIVQNTVQAFLRTMEEKELVIHRLEGRSFIYSANVQKQVTNQQLASSMLQKVFDGAMDQMVQSVISAKQPSAEELEQLEKLIKAARKTHKKNPGKGGRS
jgi:BlaI family transcriptional regulator, penicillinase repressor